MFQNSQVSFAIWATENISLCPEYNIDFFAEKALELEVFDPFKCMLQVCRHAESFTVRNPDSRRRFFQFCYSK